jgi:hypothetical protein
VQVEVRDNLISCDGWPDSYEQHNAFKPHCQDATLLPGAEVCGREITLFHPEKKAGYKEAALFAEKKKGASTKLAFRDTEDDRKILFRILYTLRY